jgi:hypothetical protein
MALRRPLASPLVVTAAWVAAALGAGCLQQAPSAMSTAAPTATATAIAPAQAELKPSTSPADTAELPNPFASPSVDSDLAPDDNAALESLADGEELQAYLPSDLIHDGGVILYRTLAQPATNSGNGAAKGNGNGNGNSVAANAASEPTHVASTAVATDDKTPKADKAEKPAKKAPPSDWKRADAKREKGRALQLRKDDGPAAAGNRRVKMTVKYAVSGTLQYTDDAGRAVRKGYRQIFDRSFKFQFKQDRWQLAEVSALHHESQGGHSGLDVTRLAIFPNGSATALDTVEPGVEKFEGVAQVATIHPGDKVRVEVAARKSDGSPVFVYAYLVGTTDRARVLLVDDGTAGDATAGDGLYTGTFLVPSASGLHHFAVDVLDPASFSAGGQYRSVGLGTSVKIQAP